MQVNHPPHSWSLADLQLKGSPILGYVSRAAAFVARFVEISFQVMDVNQDSLVELVTPYMTTVDPFTNCGLIDLSHLGRKHDRDRSTVCVFKESFDLTEETLSGLLLGQLIDELKLFNLCLG